jgi:hypothetical protein
MEERFLPVLLAISLFNADSSAASDGSSLREIFCCIFKSRIVIPEILFALFFQETYFISST